MSEEIRKHLNELLRLLDWKEMLCIVYNPKKEGIEDADARFLHYFLNEVKFQYPVVLLYGKGGNFIPGLLMPNILEKYTTNYKTYVPRTCSSALCYTLFRSIELITGMRTQITQMDPKFPYHGEELRAINHLDSENEELKDMARQAFQTSRDQIMSLLRPPSLMRYTALQYNEHDQTNTIVNLFMRGPVHESIITHKHLEEAEANVKKNDSVELQEAADNLIAACIEIMEEYDTRVIFVSSKLFKMPNEKGTDTPKAEEATYICPLK